jgi:hypothetical protein
MDEAKMKKGWINFRPLYFLVAISDYKIDYKTPL